MSTHAFTKDVRIGLAPRERKPGSSASIRAIALPVEHGGWGLVCEPIALGLLLAPSVAGLCLAIATIGLFLLRHPFKLTVSDWRRHRRSHRTNLARRFTLLYATVTALAFGAGLITSRGVFVIPLLIAAPLALVQLSFDSTGKSRVMAAELAGSISIGAVATAIVLAAGWNPRVAYGLWAIAVARSVPTILYLRTRLRMSRRQQASIAAAILAQIAGAAAMVVLAISHVVPILTVIAMTVLLLRAVIGLQRPETRLSAKVLGIRELGFGALTVFAVLVGHAINW